MTDVRNAKALVKAKLGSPSWLRGIGIAKNEAGRDVVRVNVSHLDDEVLAAVPPQLGGVQVDVVAVGDIVPLDDG